MTRNVATSAHPDKFISAVRDLIPSRGVRPLSRALGESNSTVRAFALNITTKFDFTLFCRVAEHYGYELVLRKKIKPRDEE